MRPDLPTAGVLGLPTTEILGQPRDEILGRLTSYVLDLPTDDILGLPTDDLQGLSTHDSPILVGSKFTIDHHHAILLISAPCYRNTVLPPLAPAILGKVLKKPIESVIMIIPRWPPPLF